MRLLQVSNIVSHHQIPLARSLVAALGPDSFRFAATHAPNPARQRLGWSCQAKDPWVLRAGERPEDQAAFQQWWQDADVVLCGPRRCDLFASRLARQKLLLYMSERWWKPPIGMWRLAHPRFLRMALQFRRLAASPRFHLLAIGGHAAADMRRCGLFAGRVWQWGYFTDVPQHLPDGAPRREIFNVLWAGRMLGWKRVDTLVRAFAELRSQCPAALLTLVGDGPCRGQLERLARRLGSLPATRFESSLPAAEVRQRMRNAHVYVLPSNGYEGWGAVINEAMSEGCAVVASRAAGAAATMLQDGRNGLLFTPGDWRTLAQQLRRLHDDEPLRRRLADTGRADVAALWSPRVAAERLLQFAAALLAGHSPPAFAAGPLMPLRP
jgi:glycosyltransferase involved in cell wall biosynthesis